MNLEPSPVAPSVAQPAKSFFHNAATVSVWLSIVPWIAGFLIVFLAGDIYQRMDRDIVDVVLRLVSALFVLGCALGALVLGAVAICGIPKHGRKGILVKALGGIAITVCWLLLSLLAVKT